MPLFTVKYLSKSYFLFMLTALFFCSRNANAQRNLPLNREWGLSFEKSNAELHIAKDSVQYPFKPYIVKTERQTKDTTQKWVKRKFKNESLIIVNDSADKFYLTIDPLFNFEGGADIADSSEEKLVKNTRGFFIRGDIGERFSFESTFYENQATYAQYIDDYIASTNLLFPETAIVPGQGRAKMFRENGYDFSMASGYISYTPLKQVNVQLGHGKHFVGDGYRSLLLSDNSYNYPYIRVTTRIKNFQYTNLYTTFSNLTDGGVTTPKYIERLFQKKVGSFQMLNANFYERFTLGLFQGMIWQAADTTNRQHLNVNTFNPIIGVNSLAYGLGATNNVLLGATFNAKLSNTLSLFAQFVLDDVAKKDAANDIRKKNGYQVGLKYFDAFTVKNLHLHAEFNRIRPYTYSSNKTAQSYTHYNQALAHPLGANFTETVGIINYRLKRLFVQLKVNYAVKGIDSTTYNFGGDVFKTDVISSSNIYLNEITLGQGQKATTTYQDFHLGYLVNPVTNFNIVFGVSNRNYTINAVTNTTRFVYFGIRTSLSNIYYDF